MIFEVGETFIDETRAWGILVDRVGVPRLTLFGVLGGLIERGEPHSRVWDILHVEEPAPVEHLLSDLYPDALNCLRDLRDAGLRVGIAGNMPASFEDLLRPYVDEAGSSQRWQASKPSKAFFAHVLELAGEVPKRVAYVGDRVDNDVVPAKAAGMLAVHLRRGPWGYLQDPVPADMSLKSLDALLPALRNLAS